MDHSGEDELRVRIVFDDATTDREFLSPGVRQITVAITDALLGMGERRLPYTRYVRCREVRRRPAG